MQKLTTELTGNQETLSPAEKKRALYERQKTLLATFLEHGAISKEQHDKSLRDLTEKMGYGEPLFECAVFPGDPKPEQTVHRAEPF